MKDKCFSWMLVRDCLRFLWRRDSESAFALIIDLAWDLTRKDLVDCRDYLDSVGEYRERSGTFPD